VSVYRIMLLLVLPVLAGAWWLHSSPPAATGNGFQVGEILGGIPAQGYARALQPRRFSFPVDHGPHPKFRNEWWYFTGNLEDRDSRRFGFQLVFFRNALTPDPAAGGSEWRSNQAWMAHLALTDVSGQRFHAFERFSRGGKGLAGARSDPLEVWLYDWSLTRQDGQWRLQAAAGEIAIDLTLNPQRPPLLQGRDGLSQKSSEPGNASYYYSIPRFTTGGSIRLGTDSHQVSGLSWLDREWSTSALGADQAGWDWFSLQLSDGSDLMFYRLRRKDGTMDPYSAGTLLLNGGKAIRLSADDVRLQPLGHWQSPKGGSYPVRWRLSIPSRALELTITPVLKDQELDLLVRYWEGAVDVTGSHSGRPVQGRGYLELAGYAKQANTETTRAQD
jgi:predicted secreted hydrolase